MDPQHSAQDVLRCTLCKTEVALLHCNVCHTHLCKDCEAIHLFNKTKVHDVVSIKQFLTTLTYPKCPNHPTKQCELHCKQCNVPFCTSCMSSRQHSGHMAIAILEYFEVKKEVLIKDLQEVEKSIIPKYEEAALKIVTQKADQRKNYQELTAELKKHGEALHKEIDFIIQNKQAEIDVMDSKHQAVLDKQDNLINSIIKEIKQVIQDLKGLLDTCSVNLVSKYQSRIDNFRNIPSKLRISLPTFQPVKINREQILKLFGSLTPLSIETEEQGYTVPSQGSESSPAGRSLLHVPKLITELETGYGSLNAVTCLTDEKIWTRGGDKMLKLYNLRGKLLKSVQTKSGNVPEDVASTQSGDLVYSDYHERSINLVSGTKIQTLITLRGWKPLGLCVTYFGNLLLIITADDGKQTKVVCHSHSMEQQSIQWDDQGKKLYTSEGSKYLDENRNFDICVADCHAGAVVVVSAAGILRFRYTGPPSANRGSFRPFGITTDSQANILTSDCNNSSIHVIDKDGNFLRFFDSCCLRGLRGLCVDSEDNLFVTEWKTNVVKKLFFVVEWTTSKVKKIQYYV